MQQHKSSGFDWLRLAKSDLAYSAAKLPRGGLFSVPCFHAQQAIEKGLKAVLVNFSIEFERTHSIGYLLQLILPNIEIPLWRDAAAEMTKYAVVTRYPGDYEMLTSDDQKAAAKIALQVVTWCEKILHEDE